MEHIKAAIKELNIITTAAGMNLKERAETLTELYDLRERLDAVIKLTRQDLTFYKSGELQSIAESVQGEYNTNKALERLEYIRSGGKLT